MLELIAVWAVVLGEKKEYKLISDTQKLMRAEGVDFPRVDAQQYAGAMFDGSAAPEWQDNKHCYRCRADFSPFCRIVARIF